MPPTIAPADDPDRLHPGVLGRQRARAVRAVRVLRQQGRPRGLRGRAGGTRAREGRLAGGQPVQHAALLPAAARRNHRRSLRLQAQPVDLLCHLLARVFPHRAGGRSGGTSARGSPRPADLHDHGAGRDRDRRLAHQAVRGRDRGAHDDAREQLARLLDLLHAREHRRGGRAAAGRPGARERRHRVRADDVVGDDVPAARGDADLLPRAGAAGRPAAGQVDGPRARRHGHACSATCASWPSW